MFPKRSLILLILMLISLSLFSQTTKSLYSYVYRSVVISKDNAYNFNIIYLPNSNYSGIFLSFSAYTKSSASKLNIKINQQKFIEVEPKVGFNSYTIDLTTANWQPGSNSITLSSNEQISLKNIQVYALQKSNKLLDRQSFASDQEYGQYIKKQIKPGDVVRAVETFGKVQMNDIGTYYGDLYNMACIAWNRDLGSNLSSLPAAFPASMRSHAYCVSYSSIEIINKQATDQIPPVIEVIQPKISSISYQTSKSDLQLIAKVYDNKGVFKVFVNNEEVFLAQGILKKNLKLHYGQNIVVIRAYDVSGLVSTINFIIQRTLPPDTTAPIIVFSYPKKQVFSTYTDVLTFKGKVSDNVLVKSLVINDKIPVKWDSAGNFTVTYPLVKSQNIIVFKACDFAQNCSTKSFRVQYLDDKGPTLITLISPVLEKGNIVRLTADKSICLIKAKIVDPDGISKVTINNQEAEASNDSIFWANVPLSYGTTPIEIKAWDINGKMTNFSFLISKEKQKINVDKNPPYTNKVCPQCYALLIANSKYNSAYYPALPQAENDAKVFAQYLISAFGFKRENITIVENASFLDLDYSINEFAKKMDAHPDGIFLFYYTGHGDIVGQQPIIVSVDYKYSNQDPYIINRLSLNNVISTLGSHNYKRLVIITDACFNGLPKTSIDSTIATAKSRISSLNIPVLPENAIMITGTKANQRANILPSENHSLFTFALLKTIKSYYLQHNNLDSLTYSKLYNSVKTEMDALSSQTKYHQTPQIELGINLSFEMLKKIVFP